MRNSPYSGYGYQPPRYGGYGVATGAVYQSLLSDGIAFRSRKNRGRPAFNPLQVSTISYSN